MDEELALIRALRLTADPPQAWVDAAALIPSTLGDLDSVEALIADPGFRDQFRQDPAQALIAKGLPATGPMLAALRDRLG